MKCRVCGREFQEVSYCNEYKDVCSSECFNKLYWIEKVRFYQNNPNKSVAIDGDLYYVDDEDIEDDENDSEDKGYKGFGGRRFVIRIKNSGKVIITTNLWHNGKIPEEFRDQIPDNAEFIKE